MLTRFERFAAEIMRFQPSSISFLSRDEILDRLLELLKQDFIGLKFLRTRTRDELLNLRDGCCLDKVPTYLPDIYGKTLYLVFNVPL